jgi:outer membrane protein TolC
LKKVFFMAGMLILPIPVLVIGQSAEKLSLDGAISIAVQNNPEVQRARKEVEAAESRVLQAEAIPNMELSVQFDETPTDFNIAGAGQRSIGITQPIEFPGKIRGRGKVARKDAQIMRYNVVRVTALVTSDVRRTYSKAALSRKLVSNLESIVELFRNFQEIVRTRYEARLVPFLEVVRAKVELAKVNNQLIEARRDLENDLAGLNKILGRPGSIQIEIADDLIYAPFDRTLDEVISDRKSASTALRIAGTVLDRQQAAVFLANRSYLPDFSLGLSFQRVGEQPPFNANDFNGTTINSLGIDFGLSVPLWFWKRPKGEVGEAEANYLIAGIMRAKVDRDVTTAIESAYRVVKSCETQIKIFDQSLLQDVDDELQSGITLYRNNQLDALNLIDIYRTYTSTKAEYYRALYNYHVALADLQVAGEESLTP